MLAQGDGHAATGRWAEAVRAYAAAAEVCEANRGAAAAPRMGKLGECDGERFKEQQKREQQGGALPARQLVAGPGQGQGQVPSKMALPPPPPPPPPPSPPSQPQHGGCDGCSDGGDGGEGGAWDIDAAGILLVSAVAALAFGVGRWSAAR